MTRYNISNSGGGSLTASSYLNGHTEYGSWHDTAGIRLGEGPEMLQPLALTVVWGLSFSLFVSLLLVPIMYHLLHSFKARNGQNRLTT
jgi:hypothetical protein